MKQKLIPIISIVVGILAFAMTFHYIRKKESQIDLAIKNLQAKAATIDIMVAGSDLPAGTLLASTDLARGEMPERMAPDDVVKYQDGLNLLGKKTLTRVSAGKPMQWSAIEGAEKISTGLSPIIRPGMRAISISAGGASAVSGMVQPNDRIDVLGTFSFESKTVPGEMETVTLTVLQDVTVYATGSTLAKSRRKSADTGYSTVTLEVTPREAELLVFAQQMKGRLTLSLRNPADLNYEKQLPPVDFKYLETKLPELNAFRQNEIRKKR